VPHKVENTDIQPFNDTKAGLRLTISIDSRSANQMIVRADVNFYDPAIRYAQAGAEWIKAEFRFSNGNWHFSKKLDGAIK
jgi:hypothetical protein